MKYVNIGSGWRHRLFVLQDGVLRYYKVPRGRGWWAGGEQGLQGPAGAQARRTEARGEPPGDGRCSAAACLAVRVDVPCCLAPALCVHQVYGPTAVNVHELLEALRQQGEIYPIGVEVRRGARVLVCVCPCVCVLSACLPTLPPRGAAAGRGRRHHSRLSARYIAARPPTRCAPRPAVHAGPPQVSLLESRDERMAASSGSLSSLSSPRSPRGRAKLPAPAAEIHLQVRTCVCSCRGCGLVN